ncbi:hypothetical protein DL240_08950 [Lujinxingia litoralis]|uniref:Lipoprotein n=1 Tax=Lujinxingia litoralis TaxID=2211119 RepID=A0A328C6W6_9DELT|nr:DUF6694 family lipoprotein [Lujinxingia litoralis]RAL23006.1 hypothetical protein DL240_08950 [Lujinxingia litoralis]
MYRLFLLLLGTSFLLGCSPRVDASSPEALEASITRIHEGLTETERKAFNENLEAILFNSQFTVAPDQSAEDAALKAIHGLSVKQVMKVGGDLRKDAIEALRSLAEPTIKELEALRESSAPARRTLDAFTLKATEYRLDTPPSGSAQPVMKLSLTNGTNRAVSRVHFDGGLTTPENPNPKSLDVQRFTLTLPQSLEPGESLQLIYEPTIYNPAWSVQYQEGMTLKTLVVRLDDASAEPIAESAFGLEQESSLSSLKAL